MTGLPYFLSDQIFFIYDKIALKTEWDNPETAILFFSPASVSLQDQCMLCGQLVGMTAFTENVFATKPLIFKLKNRKFATLCFENFLMVLGGKLNDPDNLLVGVLEDLKNIFQFYHGSLMNVTQEIKQFDILKEKMNDIWTSYLPFIKHKRQNVLSYLDTIAYLDFNRAGSFIYLKALQILEACQRRSCVLCGCITTNGMVVASQISPGILKYLLLLKPNQDHLPVKQLDTVPYLPSGVRIFPVHLRREEYNEILESANQSPYANSRDRRRDSKQSDSEKVSLKHTDSIKDDCHELSGSDRLHKERRNGASKSDYSNKSLIVHCESMETFLPSETKPQFSINQDVSSPDSDSVLTLKFDECNSRKVSNIEDALTEEDSKETERLDLHLPSIMVESSKSVIDATDGFAMPERERTISDVSKADRIWEAKFGNKLKDLKESVQEFTRNYRTSFGKGNLQIQFENRQLPSANEERICNESQNIHNVKMNAYRRTCEYVNSYDENVNKSVQDKVDDSASNDKRFWEVAPEKDKAVRKAENFEEIDEDKKYDDSEYRVIGSSTSHNQGRNMNVNEDGTIACVNQISSECEESPEADETMVISKSHTIADTTMHELLSSDVVAHEDNFKHVNENTSPTNDNDVEHAFIEAANTRNHFGNQKSRITEENESCKSDFDSQMQNFLDVNDDSSAEKMIDTTEKNSTGISATHRVALSCLTQNVDQQLKKEGEDAQEDLVSDKIDRDRKTPAAEDKKVGQCDLADDAETENEKQNRNEGGGHQNLELLNLYVQAHSNTVLILFLKHQNTYDKKLLKSIYETSLPQLGELEVQTRNFSMSDDKASGVKDDAVYLRYNRSEKKSKCNCKFVSQKDWNFGQTVQMLHSQFKNSDNFIDATFRNFNTATYGKRTRDQETFYQLRGTYKPIEGAPTPYDISCTMDRRVNNKIKSENIEIVL